MEQDNNDFINLYHCNRTVLTISDFVEREYIYGISPKDLFELNREIIFNQMSPEEIHAYQDSIGIYNQMLHAADLKMDMTLPCPCILKINPSKVTAEVAVNQTNLQANTDDFYAFANEKIQGILQNAGYKLDNLSKSRNDCKVFGWFKSMYYTGSNDKYKNFSQTDTGIIDLSNYIQSLSTMVNKNGGSFSFRLPVISASGFMNTITSNTDEEITSFKGTAKLDTANNVYLHNENEFFAKSSFGDVESNYFNWLISSNDLIFIRFEKLEMEKDLDEYSDIIDSLGSKSEIANNVYDMIALVDEVTVSTDAASGNAYVEISGRDLMKLLIEDGSFFFNPSTTSSPSGIFANEESYGKQGDIREADQMNNKYNNPINRLRRVAGEIDVFANRINVDIEYILKGVISQLANIEVVPGYVFNSWGDNRTKFVEIYPDKEK